MIIEEHCIVLDPSLKPITELSRWDTVTTIDNVIDWIAERGKIDPENEIKTSRVVQGKGAHENFIRYLELCWAKHYTPVVTPDIIWYTLLCEVALLIKADPERVRHLFSHTKEKQLIIVPTGSSTGLPLGLVIEELMRLVPSDAGKYLPEFTTSTYTSQLAFQAAFADAVSPYYNFGMYLCGFPSVVVRGSQQDWELLMNCWAELPGEIFTGNLEFQTRVGAGLTVLATPEVRDNPDFWREMFHLEKCGSGHQAEVRGWVVDLFAEKPKVSYAGNFSAHASRVNYRNFTTKKDFSLFAGLFSSNLTEAGVLEPYFGSFVIEDKGPVEKPVKDSTDFKVYRSPVTANTVKLQGDWTVEAGQDLKVLNGLGDE